MTPTRHLFEKKARIVFLGKAGITADDIFEEAVDAGALEVDADDGGNIIVDTEPNEVSTLAQKLGEAFGLGVESSSIIYHPKPETAVSLRDEEAQVLENVIAMIEDDPSGPEIHLNIL